MESQIHHRRRDEDKLLGKRSDCWNYIYYRPTTLTISMKYTIRNS